jgi:hypothetical protein
MINIIRHNMQQDIVSIDERSITSNTSETTRGPLPGYLLKSLATIIEREGGIRSFGGRQNHKLSTVLDKSRNEIFGKRGETIRAKIQKKVWLWQKLEEKGLYEEKVLKPLGITSYEGQMRGKEYDKVKTHRKLEVIDLQESSKSSSESSEDESYGIGIPPMPSKQFKKVSVSNKQQLLSPPAKQIIISAEKVIPLTPLTPVFSPPVGDRVQKMAALPKNASKFIIICSPFDANSLLTTRFVPRS